MKKIYPKLVNCSELSNLDCLNQTTYQIHEILNLNDDDVWKKHYDSVSEKIQYISIPKSKLTSRLNTTFALSFNNSYLIYVSNPISEGVVFPGLSLFDPRYRRMSSNLVNIPDLYLDPMQFLTGTTHYLYLRVRKITKMNRSNRPCNEDPKYNMSVCVADYVKETVGCTLEWNFYSDDEDDDEYRVCDALESIR